MQKWGGVSHFLVDCGHSWRTGVSEDSNTEMVAVSNKAALNSAPPRHLYSHNSQSNTSWFWSTNGPFGSVSLTERDYFFQLVSDLTFILFPSGFQLPSYRLPFRLLSKSPTEPRMAVYDSEHPQMGKARTMDSTPSTHPPLPAPSQALSS